MQYHRAAAVQAVDQSREDSLLCHVCSATLVLADILYDLPSLLTDECFVGIFEAELLRLRTLNALLVLEGQRGGLQVDGVAQISFVLQDTSHGVCRPVVRLGDIHSGQLYAILLVVEITRRRNLVFFELLCDLGRTLSGNTEVEDIPYHRSCFQVRYHMPFGVCRVLHIPIAGTGGNSGTSLGLETNYGATLLAAVLGIEFVHEIPEGCEVVGRLVQAVHAIVDGDEAHTVAGEDEFGVLTHLKVLTAQPGHVLHNKGFHLTVFHQLHDLLPTGAVEVRSRVTVIIQEEGVGEAFLSSILLQ